MAEVAFVTQTSPIDEYGRALYAVARSIVRAMLDQLGPEDLEDLNTDRDRVTLRQLAKIARLDRDKGLRGDGFEWAVHEAVVGREPRVSDLVAEAVVKSSRYLRHDQPASLLFGHERAQYLGFLDAVIENAGERAVLLPDGRGHPYAFGPWVALAALGQLAEGLLTSRIQQVWKTDIFLTTDHVADEKLRYVATTIKSNYEQLEAGRGLRLGIVPEAPGMPPGVHRYKGLWVVSLPDPNGFMGLFNDAYSSVAAAIITLGKHVRGPYYLKPSAKGGRLQTQMEKYGEARVVEVEAALNDAAQQDLVDVQHKLVSVEAPSWLHITERRPRVIAPRPRFEKLD